MTPLQQAAFKANVDICHLLLAHGADVNSSEHNQGYTALMFAALSGIACLSKNKEILWQFFFFVPWLLLRNIYIYIMQKIKMLPVF